MGTIQNSLGDLQSLTVVSLRRKDAQGCTRGKRAFGQRMQDELVLTSLRGLEMAKSTMKYLGGDMFFKKWSMPLIPWSQLPVMKYDDYLKLFAVDQTLDISSRRFGLGGAWKFPHHGEGAKKLPPRFRSAHPSGVHILCDYFKTYVGEMLHVLRNISYTQIARSCLTTLIAGSFQTCNKPCFRLTI